MDVFSQDVRFLECVIPLHLLFRQHREDLAHQGAPEGQDVLVHLLDQSHPSVPKLNQRNLIRLLFYF